MKRLVTALAGVGLMLALAPPAVSVGRQQHRHHR